MADPAEPLVGYGEVQLQLMAESSNSYDALALAGLAILVAAIAALASLKTVIGTGWWAPIIPLAIAVLECLGALTAKGIDVGKPLARVVVENEGKTEDEINGVLIGELALALQQIAPQIETKRSRLTGALLWVGISGVLSAALFPNV